MSSGSYFPKPVKLVEILKSNGGVRPLGIPTVEDRIAQMVLCSYERAELRLVDELGETKRGSGGFGSTGVRNDPSAKDGAGK